MVKELELIEDFRDLSLVCEVTPTSVKLGMLKVDESFSRGYQRAPEIG